MTAPPLPDASDPLAAPFWKAMRDGRLLVPVCRDCGRTRWPIAPNCQRCSGTSFEWSELEARGVVWSLATYHRAFHPAFAALVPYTIALVDLTPDVQLPGRVLDPGGLAIGDTVHARFEPIDDAVTVLVWQRTVTPDIPQLQEAHP